MKILLAALIVFGTLTGCTLAYSPTAPTPFVETPKPVVTQLSIRVVGPDSWWPDRLYVMVETLDATGSPQAAIVTCDSTEGVFEPSSFLTRSWNGVLVRGINPGATVSCHYNGVTASYTVNKLDWRVISGPGVTPGRPPVVVPVPVVPVVPVVRP